MMMTYDWIIHAAKNPKFKQEILNAMTFKKDIQITYLDMYRITFENIDKTVFIRPYSSTSAFHYKIVPTRISYDDFLRMINGGWKYVCVEWTHDFNDEPFKIYSELDIVGYETRKIELFKDGTYGYAYRNIERGSRLGKEPFPEELNEIDDEPELRAFEITKEDFEKVWVEIYNKDSNEA